MMRAYVYRAGSYEPYPKPKDTMRYGPHPSRYLSCLGNVEVYTGYEETAHHEFLCVLSIGGGNTAVWLDFPDLVCFLKEIEARPENGSEKEMQEDIARILHDLAVGELTMKIVRGKERS